MGNKVFKVDLSVKSIENLKEQLLDYKNNELHRKLNQFVEELARVGIPVIHSRMEQASYTYDDSGVRSGANPNHSTYIKLDYGLDSAKATLIVSGEELLFIEFGAGVYYNASVGDSNHPKGKEFGFTIGSYGKGYGARKVWGYYAEGGDLILTRGVKATMPVYSAYKEIRDSVTTIARRVFS